jgi:hypothetical protein
VVMPWREGLSSMVLGPKTCCTVQQLGVQQPLLPPPPHVQCSTQCARQVHAMQRSQQHYAIIARVLHVLSTRSNWVQGQKPGKETP